MSSEEEWEIYELQYKTNKLIIIIKKSDTIILHFYLFCPSKISHISLIFV